MAFDLYTVPVTHIDGAMGSMSAYQGQVLLVVNVASQCGLTEQYAWLEELQQRFQARGFNVLGFPANDFAGQEPGTDAEIHEFCTGNFGVGFPMFSKITVTGPDKHPLYAELIAQQPESIGEGKAKLRAHLEEFLGGPTNAEPEVLWNFEKFLVGRDGAVIARFSPDTLPTAPGLMAAVERALAA